MNTRSTLSRLQVTLLEGVRDLGLCTDVSLTARLEELGETIDRTALVKWRAGDRAAPLGLLPVLLGHVSDPAAVLDLLAAPFGLRVVPASDTATDRRGLADRALEIGDLAGDVAGAVRRALADGRIDDEEREAIHRRARDGERRFAELAAITAITAGPPGVRRSA